MLPKSYSDQELHDMAVDGESDLLERKRSLGGDAPDRIREAICAFANDLAQHQRPGVIAIGANDDGTPSGVPVTDELLRQLADMKNDGNIVPPPTLTVAKRMVNGAEMAVVTVWPADSPPVRYRGRIHIRLGSRRGIASAQDERILNEKRRYGDRPFDAQPVRSAELADLDRRSFEENYLVSAVAADVLEANDRTYEQRLAAMKLVTSADDPVPTVVGVLVLCTRCRDFLPGAYIQFLRVEGCELADPVIDTALLEGPIGEILRRLDDKLASHNRISIDITSGHLERRQALFPLPALQQITRNAVLHRTYESSNAPVRVTWYDDRIEITSPGGPYGSVTQENFGQTGISDYRNPNLAEALRVLGFVQRFGVGIALAERELRTNGSPPLEFDVHASHVRVTLRPPARTH